MTRREPPPRGRGVGVLLIALAAAGCSDSIRPVMGGLKLGMQNGAFQPPILAVRELPFEYPPEAWKRRVGGQTVLRMLISRSGEVDSVLVIKSSGNLSLDSAAVAGSRRLRYRPARQGGEPIEVWARLPVIYPLPEEARPYEP